MAIGAMQAARERHQEVPAHISIAGYDDIDAAALLSPPLTTVHNPAYELGRHSARLLLDLMSGGATHEPRQLVVPPYLVTRESTASPED
jgi:LacI family transcriptional regulator